MSTVEMNTQVGVKKRSNDELAGRAFELIGWMMGVTAAVVVATIVGLLMWEETHEFMQLRNPATPISGESVGAVNPEFDRFGAMNAETKLSER